MPSDLAFAVACKLGQTMVCLLFVGFGLAVAASLLPSTPLIVAASVTLIGGGLLGALGLPIGDLYAAWRSSR